MGMIMHDDVPYGEGTSYTQGTGIAINNNIIAVDADNTPTENSEKPVKSKGVYEVVEQIYADNGVLGAKNLLENVGSTITQSGITATYNSDGSILLNGTATANIGFVVSKDVSNNNFLPNGKYILSGSAVFSDNCYLWINKYVSGSGSSLVQLRTSGEVEFAIDTSQYDGIKVGITVRNGATLSNFLVKPMLRLASDPDDTYVPYAMTNRELTEAVDEFTPSVSPVNSVVTFPDLNPDYGYELYVDIPDETTSLPTNLTDLPVCKWTKVQRSTKADGTITLAYTVTNINVNYCLRILK